MGLGNFVKRVRDIMRNDAGISGDAQRIEQMAWILFLKVYDAKEQEWEALRGGRRSAMPERLRWGAWAADRRDGRAPTGDELLGFVNNELFPALKGLGAGQAMVRQVFEDANNYMKNGVLLRQVINVVDELDFARYSDRHAFGEIYETILRSLQSAGSAGEFYTPRAVTDFMARMAAPKLGERIADFACGTGGFLTSALKELDAQVSAAAHREMLNRAIHGMEKKPLPHLLCVTNMLLHDVDAPDIAHGNSLDRDVREYGENDRFDVVLMNPPYGGSELEGVKMNFPPDLRSSETADLFIVLIMHRLKKTGRAAVIIPDGFLFGADAAKTAIKRKLLTDFDLHTVLRLPRSVFAPYTGITTNILFFRGAGPTRETWFYRLDMPEGYKNFSKTRPMRAEHFAPAEEWWANRREMATDGFDKARRCSASELAARNHNLDICGYPHEEEETLPPLELIARHRRDRAALAEEMERLLGEIEAALE